MSNATDVPDRYRSHFARKCSPPGLDLSGTRHEVIEVVRNPRSGLMIRLPLRIPSSAQAGCTQGRTLSQ